MAKILWFVAAITAVLWLLLFVEMLRGHLATKFLRAVEVKTDAPLPKVSVIIPACNEARNLAEALQSVLRQDYENLEFIVINDRSTDQTGAILQRIAASDARLQVVEITRLPQGWLGKNYALHCGAQRAHGDIFLFTDADIVLHPQAISKAVTFLIEQRRHHLTMAPETHMPTALLGIFVAAFALFFAIYARPWKAKNPRSRYHIGIGAFNLVRAEVYRAVGGHKPLAMRPDDDLKLGKLIKKHGYRQEFLFGKGMISVEWYASLRGLIQGLEKNTFAGLEYSVLATISASVGLVGLSIWPFAAIFLTTGGTQLLYLAVVLVILLLNVVSAQFHESKRWYACGFPLAAALFVFILWRSMIVTLRHRGINWRGTHYALDELKANKV
ncbi:MAG: glycosyltransferase [Acidobacteria bacterium]|nr:glycosyltransferase [Acidobacteriota bacterium]